MKAIEETITLYRPTGPKEIELVKENNFKRWPARLAEQPIFYPVTNEKYAREIAEKWNVKNDGIGYVTQFEVRKSFLNKYEIKQVGSSYHTEYWIPSEDLEELNNNIVGIIKVIGEYH